MLVDNDRHVAADAPGVSKVNDDIINSARARRGVLYAIYSLTSVARWLANLYGVYLMVWYVCFSF
jgi:hypothetical protein